MMSDSGWQIFERFADDIVVHCAPKEQAEQLLKQIRQRLAHVKLSLHPEKTKVVYCKNGKRPQDHDQTHARSLPFF